MEWFSQEKNMDSCCFVYAAANAMLYKGMPVPDLEPIKDLACCRTGATIGPRRVVEALALPLEPTNDVEEVMVRGGILSIMHPLFNLHAVFAFPEERSVTLVNSLLGRVEEHAHPNMIRALMPRFQVNCNHWVFKR